MKRSSNQLQPMTCGVVIANSAALANPGSTAAAAIIGGFDIDKEGYIDIITSLSLDAMMLYGKDPNTVNPEMKRLCEIINDDNYVAGKRTRLPEELCAGHELYLFNSMLQQKYFPDGEIDSPFVFMAAAPAGGDIMHLPPEIVEMAEQPYDPNIIEHEEPKDRGFVPPAESISMDIVNDHIEKHLGKDYHVFHEIISETVHLDIYIIPPSEGRTFTTLMTGGMSDLPMTTPTEHLEFSRAELVMRLPKDWPLKEADLKSESNYWPIRIMKVMARMPHELSTWLCHGHTVPLGDGAATGGFQGVVLAPPVWADEAFAKAALGDGSNLYFWSLIPLYEAEVDYKLKHGSDALFEKLDKIGAWDLVTVGRPSAV